MSKYHFCDQPLVTRINSLKHHKSPALSYLLDPLMRGSNYWFYFIKLDMLQHQIKNHMCVFKETQHFTAPGSRKHLLVTPKSAPLLFIQCFETHHPTACNSPAACNLKKGCH
ncbi:unnamed protein product [Sphenostylis stenocarpa]|uniref:Uncharacterized protein n=1 Tax=Sphenostylis stenocarpa TaxID=92480 RepID=A0AA86VP37_9FABA|nr:unnamed protein product [Sphenostylis stenocarpa]